ncbi:MAG: hypothetical protein P1P88_21410 [Bacteroidales bacterium]|nr:hypothetical protein [Bacteroidales bacterium]
MIRNQELDNIEEWNKYDKDWLDFCESFHSFIKKMEDRRKDP